MMNKQVIFIYNVTVVFVLDEALHLHEHDSGSQGSSTGGGGLYVDASLVKQKNKRSDTMIEDK